MALDKAVQLTSNPRTSVLPDTEFNDRFLKFILSFSLCSRVGNDASREQLAMKILMPEKAQIANLTPQSETGEIPISRVKIPKTRYRVQCDLDFSYEGKW
ncbi:hypothetical protein [Agrobacterium sp. 22-226-1]